jgi:soluble cytochrome b562
LMKKSNTILPRPVKEEIGFIFARGTGPLYTADLSELVDLLSKARYLDVVSRKQSDLYKLIITDWNATKPTFETKTSIEEVLENKEDTVKLHHGAIILRDLDNVERFISSNSTENSDLANILMPDWNSLKSKLQRANSVDDIIESESEISKMKKTTDISSRISKSIEISKDIGVDTGLLRDWEQLLEDVDDASSIDEILEIVSAFDRSMTELREKRNPISILKFEYRAMKEQAELQADYNNLFLIDNALKILDTAEQMASGNPSITRIDRIEVLLVWASEIAPKIKSDLDAQDEEAIKARAGNVLERAKSLENLVELSLKTKRFLPGFINFSETFNEKIDDARDLVIEGDIDAADEMVRDLFVEWREVSHAYDEDPYGSDWIQLG